MIWPILAVGVIGFGSGAVIATWWHRTEPERRQRIRELLAEIFADLD